MDEAVEESFPASDPPSWGPLHVGGPGEHPGPIRRPAEETGTDDHSRLDGGYTAQ